MDKETILKNYNMNKKNNPKKGQKILEVQNICKTYQAKNGEVKALNNINFSVEKGEYKYNRTKWLWKVNITFYNCWTGT